MTLRQRKMLPTRGWGPWRADFYGFSSKLRYCDPATEPGVWVNRWVHNIDSFIYAHFRRTWRWWHNRPDSKTRRNLERFFPNLRASRDRTRLGSLTECRKERLK